VTGSGQASPSPAPTRAKNTTPSATLEAGPAMAMVNSARGSAGSSIISETPPKMNRVMLLISSPCARATREWLISWKMMEKKRPSAPRTPMVQ